MKLAADIDSKYVFSPGQDAPLQCFWIALGDAVEKCVRLRHVAEVFENLLSRRDSFRAVLRFFAVSNWQVRVDFMIVEMFHCLKYTEFRSK